MKTIHYANLSRGVLCPVEADRVIRLQSTWCEQKRWADVLWTTSPDLLYHLAIGDACVIHDQSEKPRQTRACWQGLSWIRYATGRAWYDAADPEFSRTGMNVTPYWQEQYRGLDDRVITYLKAFRKYAGIFPGDLSACNCPQLGEGSIAA